MSRMMAPPELSLLHGASPRTARSHSISSDRPSLNGYGGLLSPPLSISPEPAFIAASAASQIVTNDHDSQAETWFDQHGIEPSGETALVAPPALKLINRFLDQLLFNFLSVSRSTSLASLRPAVGEVLKPKLGREAISGADQELHEYLGGGEDEELVAFHNGLEPAGDWDLELIWKRTRLRCMVYSSLGDMEEEDEDFYTEQEQLDGPPGSNNRFSNNSGVVSPAVAIFLTSILEFMGEQVLMVAGQAAYHRLRVKHDREERDGTSEHSDIAERVVVEESDMERVALDRTLGRLWRGWKKRIRSPAASVSMSRSFSRESLRSQAQASQSASTGPDEPLEADQQRPSISAIADLAEYEYAAGIPLPMSEQDVREIEIPGLAKQGDDEDQPASSEEDAIQPQQRPKSLIMFGSHTRDDVLTVTSPPQHTPIFVISKSRKRAHSLPPTLPSPYTVSSSKRPKTASGEKTEDQEDSTESLVTNKDRGEQVEGEGDEPQGEEIDNDMEATREHNEQKESKGLVAGVIAGAAVIGAATVAGIAAAATGQAPQTVLEQEEADVDEEFSEEPQIMTSSRISIGGRISPDDPKSPSRPSSVRSPSISSVRLIDVASPKSPSRSLHGSVDAIDCMAGRPILGSRPSSIHSLIDSQTPRVSSPILRGSSASPLARVSSSVSSRHVRSSAEDSISEEKEVVESTSAPLTPIPTDFVVATQADDVKTTPTAHKFVSEPSTRDAMPPQAAPLALSAPPGTRTMRGTTNKPTHDQHVTQPKVNSAVSPKSLGGDSGVPPLTPLREMMEGAPDTSDEASSIAPSYDTYSISEYGVTGHTPSASASSLAQTQRLVDLPRSVRPQAGSIPRNSPPRSSREDLIKESSGKSQRAIHTSGSGSGSSSTSQKLTPTRPSEDSASNRVEDKSKSFEQLIRSDQTIQYTLTPQNMRNIEANPDSPRFSAAPVVISGQDTPRSPTTRSHPPSAGKLTGLHSNPPAEKPKSVKSVKLSKPAATPIANSGARLRANAPQPRDARVKRESMGDLTEFISSTAPPGSYDQTPPQSAPVVNSHRGMNGTSRNASGSIPRIGTAASLPRRAESSAGRSKLQARDAAVSRGDSISDLIDFVRSGPQLEKESHRIPRTVAPFRTTMDSDQMSGAVGGKAIDASLPDPRYSQASASVHSSVTSQSALLTKTQKVLPIQNSRNSDEDMMPKRKTRRVRDMYQIDFSDEEEEYEILTNSRPKPIKEESLAEFLANVPPPPDTPPTPIYDAASKQGDKIKKKSSSTSLMSRFGRRDSGAHQPPSKPKSSGHDSRSLASRGSSRPPQLPTHTPIAVQFSSNNPIAYQPARSNNSSYVSQLDSARNRVAQKSYQPREAVYATTRTSDLADFLRSEPPSSIATRPQTFTPSHQKEEGGAFQRMFGRKKVH